MDTVSVNDKPRKVDQVAEYIRELLTDGREVESDVLAARVCRRFDISLGLGRR